MIEIIKINWVPLVAGIIWISGLAGIVALLSTAVFLKRSQTQTGETVLQQWKEKKIPVRALTFCSVLIISGVLLGFFKPPTTQLLIPQITGMAEAQLINEEGTVIFPLKTIIIDPQNRRHKRNTTEIIDQTAALFFEGDIKTPLVKFKGGHYTLNFHARGSKAWDEYSILRVDYRELDENNYLLLKKSAYVNLTATMEHYQIPFQTTNTTQSAIGRLEISFVNDDLEPGGKKDRNAWVKEIKIESK